MMLNGYLGAKHLDYTALSAPLSAIPFSVKKKKPLPLFYVCRARVYLTSFVRGIEVVLVE
jgi:hypothetical protein